MPSDGLQNHVVIAGGGRVGDQIASIFQKLDFPLVIVEQDFRRFEKSKKAGYPVIYGDASQEIVLLATKLEHARLVVVTIPHISTARQIVEIVSTINPGAKIIARADELDHMYELCKMNIQDVVQPEFEASLEIIRQSLMHLEVPVTKIYEVTENIRQHTFSNRKLERLDHSFLEKARKTPFLLQMSWLGIQSKSPMAGRSIKELKIRSTTGVSVVGVLRENRLIPNPDADFVFKKGDYIAIIGLPDDKKRFELAMVQ